jgi:hypothetical protein
MTLLSGRPHNFFNHFARFMKSSWIVLWIANLANDELQVFEDVFKTLVEWQPFISCLCEFVIVVSHSIHQILRPSYDVHGLQLAGTSRSCLLWRICKDTLLGLW